MISCRTLTKVHQGSFEVKNGPQNKNCTIKIKFIRTNNIQDDAVNHKGKICKNNGGKKKKLLFLIIFLAYLLTGSPKNLVWVILDP